MTTAEERVAQLDAAIAAFNLNNHPFYQDWRMGTLPTEKLTSYAAEYGAFVATIDKGWETLGFPAYAQEEREHDAMWQDFRAELGAGNAAVNPATHVLTHAANTYFASRAEAAGALYAFEAQQPHTSRSKLDGLREHYKMSEKAEEYFVVHADDVHEAEDLRQFVAKMSEAEFARTRTACAVMSAAMWSALDGVYYN